MPIFNGYAIALRAHGKRCGTDAAAFERSEQLLRLLFHLLFFVLDVGDDVAQDVERRNAWVSSSANGLHRYCHDGFELETTMEGSERNYQSNGRAVGIGDGEASRFAVPGLSFDERDVIGVDFRNDQRNVSLHAQGAGIGNDSASGVGKLRLQFAGN